MASIQDGPNPYRPYHAPASNMPPLINTTSRSAVNSSTARSGSTFNLGSSARDALSDLDYSDYLSDASPSVIEVLKKLVDQGLWKYSSTLLAQPFDVAKIVLQIQDAGSVTDKDIKPEEDHKHRNQEDIYHSDEDEDDDTQSYFTSSAPTRSTRSQREYQRTRKYSSSSSKSWHSSPSGRSQTTAAQQNPHTKALTSTSSLTTVLSSLWSTEGAWGVWKGTNGTFWYSVLLSTISSFLRSFFCAVLALPDPTVVITALPSPSTLARLDILSSPSPITSLILSVSASGLAGLLLSPLDVARTRLIATPTTHPPRSIISTVSSLSSWIVPTSIAPVTILHSTLPTLITASTPLFLRSRLGLDPSSTPTPYAALTFLSQAFELSIRLPIETVLRRGQIHSLKSSHPPSISNALQTTIPTGPYTGLWGTFYHIIYEEGSRPIIRPLSSSSAQTTSATSLSKATPSSSRSSRDPSSRLVNTSSTAVEGRRRKGQGVEGLYRGWRVGAWGLLGMWTAHFVGGGGGGGGGSGF